MPRTTVIQLPIQFLYASDYENEMVFLQITGNKGRKGPFAYTYILAGDTGIRDLRRTSGGGRTTRS